MANRLQSDGSGAWEDPSNVNTMAMEIYLALDEVIPRGPAEDPSIRQRLATAIARGVLRHLQRNTAAFRVNVDALNADTEVAISIVVGSGTS